VGDFGVLADLPDEMLSLDSLNDFEGLDGMESESLAPGARRWRSSSQPCPPSSKSIVAFDQVPTEPSGAL
jgi:hypothetical protein